MISEFKPFTIKEITDLFGDKLNSNVITNIAWYLKSHESVQCEKVGVRYVFTPVRQKNGKKILATPAPKSSNYIKVAGLKPVRDFFNYPNEPKDIIEEATGK